MTGKGMMDCEDSQFYNCLLSKHKSADTKKNTILRISIEGSTKLLSIAASQGPTKPQVRTISRYRLTTRH